MMTMTMMISRGRLRREISSISEYLMPELLDNGTLVPTGSNQIQVLRHQFAFHCTTSYLGTEEEQAARVIPAIWKAPYERIMQMETIQTILVEMFAIVTETITTGPTI